MTSSPHLAADERGAKRGCRVLVIDDDRDFVEALRDVLDFEGFIVDVAYGSQQALECELADQPDIALIDIRLGADSGIELTAKLKQRREDLICIMITGNADLESTVESLRAGADDYLRKPFQPAELIASIDSNLQKLQLKRDKAAAELALRDSEQRFGDIAANVPGVVFQLKADRDRNLSFPYVSASIKEALGVEASQVAAAPRAWFDLIHEDDRAAWDATLEQSRATLETWQWEGRMIRPGGKVGWFRGSSTPRKLDDGAVLWNGLIIDITDHVHAEEQLRQSQKMEAVGQLTGGVAHDFNNLLAIVLGNAELLNEELGADKGALLKPVIRAATRGAELTERLLAFSRKQALRPQNVAPGDLVEGMRELLTRSLRETIEVETAPQAGVWRLFADPGQLENAILNLAINARDAMSNGGRLTIAWRNAVLDEAFAEQNPGAPDGEFIALSVADTGSGMSQETLAHAFEPFFTTKEVGEGTGLGLSMVYGFAKQSDGYVTIESAPGAGTTVTLYLPRAEPAEDRKASGSAAAMPAGDGEVILVLEDDVDVRDYVATILERLDYRVLQAANSHDALAVLTAEDRVDLLLSDIILPGGSSGPELARTAREKYPSLKVVFMSGYAGAATDGNGGLDGDEIVLNKPFPRLELAETVRAALDR